MYSKAEINLRLDRINEALKKQHEEILELRKITKALYKELYKKKKTISNMAESERQKAQECRDNKRS